MSLYTKRLCALLLALALLFAMPACRTAEQTSPLADAAAYLMRTVQAPQYGSVGGEWAVLGLARGGYGNSDYFETYYANLSAFVREQNGVLHARKYTEYARVVLALTAIGKDPRDVGGYDLLSPLGDCDRVTAQGLNGAVFALLALDAGGYAVPDAPAGGKQATREAYLAEILSYAAASGGFSLDAENGTADADITAMALCALAPYADEKTVFAAISDAFRWLSAAQGDDGGYGSAESCAQVLIALSAYGIAADDARFVKNGRSALDALLSYAVPGGYRHMQDDADANAMASEQALLALVAVERQKNGQSGLYAMAAE